MEINDQFLCGISLVLTAISQINVDYRLESQTILVGASKIVVCNLFVRMIIPAVIVHVFDTAGK